MAIRVHFFRQNTRAWEYLGNLLRTGDTVLFKGSNGMELFEIVEWLQSREELHGNLREGDH